MEDLPREGLGRRIRRRGKIGEWARGKARSIGGEKVIVRRMETAEDLHGGGSSLSQLSSVSASHGTAELALTNKGDDLVGELARLSLKGEAAGSGGDVEKG